MAVNYAEKYSDKIDEQFKLASLTQSAFNNDYDFEGVSTVHVYSVATAPLNNYQTTGSQRFGTPDELGSSVQTLTLAQDKGFTFTIDRRSYSDQQMVMDAGRALRRQIDEVVIPHVDTYRLARLVAGAGTTSPATPLTSPYDAFLTGVTTLLDNKAPLAGTFAFVGPEFYKKIRLDDGFVKASDAAQQMLINGQVGTIENIPLIYVPSSYLPADVEFIISNKMAAVAPVKLTSYEIHDKVFGLDGWGVQGRIYFDAFVLKNKAKAVYVHKSA